MKKAQAQSPVLFLWDYSMRVHTRSGGWPWAYRCISSKIISLCQRSTSQLMPAKCDVISTLSRCNSGWFSGAGSCHITSIAAPAMRFSSNALSMLLIYNSRPAVLTKTAVDFICANHEASTMPRVSSLTGRWMETTSDVDSASANDTFSQPQLSMVSAEQ